MLEWMRETIQCQLPSLRDKEIAVLFERFEKDEKSYPFRLVALVKEDSLSMELLFDFGASHVDVVEMVSKPFPNEHACRIKQPTDFEEGSFRTTSRAHKGKTYRVIMGKVGEAFTEQAYRYPKTSWTAGEARNHCDSHDGIMFEAARKSQDIDVLDYLSKSIDILPADPMMRVWFNYEGSDGETTRVMVDKGEFYVGAAKEGFAELFFEGEILKGRYVVRSLMNNVLFEKAATQVPYVFSTSAIKDKWLPPSGKSALPLSIRKAVPEELMYWEKVDKDALDARKKCAIWTREPRAEEVPVRKSVEWVIKATEPEYIIGGIVYEPNVADLQEDMMTKEEIWKLMKHYMIHGRQITVEHGGKQVDLPIVESFQPEEPTMKHGQRIPEGAFWLAVYAGDHRDVFKDAQDGKITGFSMEGWGKRRDVE